MLEVAPLWRVAALTLPLLAMAGCEWIPVRRRIDPSLYPVPTRPEAAYIRGDRRVPGRPRPVPPAAGPEIARGPKADRLPPLPELTPVAPDEILPTPSTPLIDAAIVRADAIRSALLAPEPDFGPIAPADPTAIEAMPAPPSPIAGPPDEPTSDEPVAEDEPSLPIPSPIEDDREQSDFEGSSPPIVEASRTVESVSIATIELPPPPPVEAVEAVEATVESEVKAKPDAAIEPAREPESPGRADLAALLAMAETESDRQRILDRIAEAEADGIVDETTRWQLVMTMLAEPRTAEAPGPTFQVTTLALCREVLAFGRFEELDPADCRAGQDLIVYCALEDVRYEPSADGDSYDSRLITTLQILPAAEDAPPVWRDVRSVSDSCPRARRDYFVCYWLTLPDSIAPGRYRLQVDQRDRLSGLDASGALTFVIHD